MKSGWVFWKPTAWPIVEGAWPHSEIEEVSEPSALAFDRLNDPIDRFGRTVGQTGFQIGGHALPVAFNALGHPNQAAHPEMDVEVRLRISSQACEPRKRQKSVELEAGTTGESGPIILGGGARTRLEAKLSEQDGAPMFLP